MEQLEVEKLGEDWLRATREISGQVARGISGQVATEVGGEVVESMGI